jgi:hypothetical protein
LWLQACITCPRGPMATSPYVQLFVPGTTSPVKDPT